VSNKALFTQAEAATYLGVKVSYLRAEASIVPRELPGHGEKGRPLIRYHKDDLDKWLSDLKNKGGRKRA
jgi:hypothetical protein